MSPGRWHSAGRPIVYLAPSPAGALVEVLVHLELDLHHMPKSYKLLKAEAPDEFEPRKLEDSSLPENWREDYIVSRTTGDTWLALAESALLEVPSAILPETYNLLLNPLHSDARRIRVLWHREFPYDPRLFKIS